MFLTAVGELVALSLFVACGYAALKVYAYYRRPDWSAPLLKRRVAVLGVLTLGVTGIKVIEDVLAKESGPIDEALLGFIRDHMTASLVGFFELVTLSGSAAFIAPATLLAAAALLIARRRFEAALLVVSVVCATMLIFVLKTLVGRTRPELWETPWYSGSSFPSGHTLGTAALATAAALCIARIRPRAGRVAMALAMMWTALVALSRLVLGVHWPTDVMAATCLGVFIPLALSVGLDLRPPATAGPHLG